MIKNSSILLSVLMVFITCEIVVGQKKGKIGKEKTGVIEFVDAHSSELTDISDKIWAFEETAFEEYKSSALLASYAEENGFTVERGVAGMPTAFVATYGSGKPVIGILGEFDALPGLSQKIVPEKDPLNEGAPGHGCGHNLFGTASLGAAVAIKEQIENGSLKGTIKFYGTPAEEKYFGKIWMVREGLFDDLDACLDWHPSATTEAAAQSSKALVDFVVEFYGQAAHASADPWNGRSAVDGLEFFTMGLNYMREHVKPTVRIHYHIQNGGAVVNVVPDYSRIWTRVRDSKMEDVKMHYERVKKVAEGAAMMANVDYKISLVSGIYEIVPNYVGAQAMDENMRYLGPIEYTDEEVEYAKAIQKATDKPQVGLDDKIHELREPVEHPQGGSTDVGDVSWAVPVVRMGAATAPTGTPWHSWAVVACGGMSIGHKGMLFASKALAMTAVDLFKDEDLRNKVKEEFIERKGDGVYEAFIPDGPPPIPSN